MSDALNLNRLGELGVIFGVTVLSDKELSTLNGLHVVMWRVFAIYTKYWCNKIPKNGNTRMNVKIKFNNINEQIEILKIMLKSINKAEMPDFSLLPIKFISDITLILAMESALPPSEVKRLLNDKNEQSIIVECTVGNNVAFFCVELVDLTRSWVHECMQTQYNEEVKRGIRTPSVPSTPGSSTGTVYFPMEGDPVKRVCIVCKKENVIHKCGKCGRFYYCGSECQIKHWKEGFHNINCALSRAIAFSEINE
jgi:hypothetical protein